MAKDKNTIRAILICSEGKTEKIFFNIIANNYDIKSRMPVWIEGEKGQLKTLIDYTVAERKKIAKKYNIRQQNIEAWAVCDDDRRKTSYSELCGYSKDRDVNLAYSRPQFESYLLQHFEQSKDKKRETIFKKLSHIAKANGSNEGYRKNSLEWLENLVSQDDRTIDIGIVNANMRQKRNEIPFFTVQNLTERLKKLKF